MRNANELAQFITNHIETWFNPNYEAGLTADYIRFACPFTAGTAKPTVLANAVTKTFRALGLVPTSESRPSTHPAARGRRLTVWRRAPQA